MLKIGLTGGIGSGKSVVTEIFKVLNVPVFSADNAGKILLGQNEEIKSQVVDFFGDQAIKDGNIDTKYLAGIVFADKDKLNLLNSIIHPEVRRMFESWLGSIKNKPYVIEESAILFESGLIHDFDYTVLVIAEYETRIRRVMQRDGVSQNQVIKRMENQLPDKEKLKMADFIINNNEKDLILERVLELHNKFISL